MADNAKPIFLLAGHAKSPDSALAMAVEQAGIPKPSVAYVGAASGDNRLFFRWMKTSLHAAGAGNVELVRTAGTKADIKKAVDRLWASDLIHIGGGDVEAGMRILTDTNLVDVLRECYQSGKPVSGLSAGSIMLGSQWIRWENPDDDDSVRLFPCLGLAPVCCDTHGEDDDFLELRTLVSLLLEGDNAYGICSGAGLIVDAKQGLRSVAGSVRTYRKSGAGVERMADLP
jgi:peptidase E